jgi:cell division protein FtsN
MAHDFAKTRSGSRRPRRAATPRATSPDSHWSWFFTGLITGVFVTFIGYLGFLKNSPKDPAQAAPVETAQQNSGRSTLDFQFYDYLPEAEVQVNVVPVNVPVVQIPLPPPTQIEPVAADDAAPVSQALPAAAAPAAIASAMDSAVDSANYLLQAGSFQERNDAETRRANIILLNMPASVVPGVVSGKTWYRVQVGPFTGRQAAEEARATLALNNIDSIPLRMR